MNIYRHREFKEEEEEEDEDDEEEKNHSIHSPNFNVCDFHP